MSQLQVRVDWQAWLGAMAPAVAAVAQQAHRLNMPLALVGGSVRDGLLGLPGRDIDLVAVGSVATLMHEVTRHHGGIVRHRRAFDTASWQPPASNASLDVAAARQETYARPGALPTVRPSDLEGDLRRRDFTANAMAWTLRDGRPGPWPTALVDPHGGQADIAKGRLRALHPASFVDDPTRIFRGCRLAARLGWRWSPGTWARARAALAGGALATLSPKRLGAELQRLLEEEPATVIAAARRLRAGPLGPWWQAPTLPRDLRRLFAVVAAQGGAPAANLGRSERLWLLLALRTPQEQRGDLQAQAAHLGRPLTRRLAAGPTRLDALATAPAATRALAWAACDAVERDVAQAVATGALGRWLRRASPSAARPPTLTGDDLIEAGLRPGPGFKRALEVAALAAHRGSGRAQQLAAARAYLDVWGEAAVRPSGR